ncbi:hypothetical protein B0H13DRAFT_1917808 [Mycena leptocephala]|nr:hypothetical protein B0H13DRAFT_1917808 [Mycena leptocephala]
MKIGECAANCRRPHQFLLGEGRDGVAELVRGSMTAWTKHHPTTLLFLHRQPTIDYNMHPHLELDTFLNDMPPPIHDIAAAACKDNRRFQDMKLAAALFDTLDGPQKATFLPIFFHNLDPVRIPSPEQLELFDRPARDDVSCAVLSLHLFFNNSPHLDLGVSVWPRIWSWVNYIHIHWDHLPGIALPLDVIFYIDFFVFAGRFRCDSRTCAFMSTTPGFRTLVAKAWTFLPAIVEPHRLVVVTTVLGFVLDDLNNRDSAQFEEIIEGAGGSLGDLAILVVKYIHSVVENQDLTSDVAAALINILLSFIRNTDLDPEGGEERQTTNTVRECFRLLARILISSPGYMFLEEAIKSGMLRAIVMCATLPSATELHPLSQILLMIVLMGLIPYHVVRKVGDSLNDLEDLVSAPNFQCSGLINDWEKFVRLVEDQVEVMAKMGERISMKACDNLQCTKIEAKSLFKRCAGCQVFCYCSQDCQLIDWRNGGHRVACRSDNTLSLIKSALALGSLCDRGGSAEDLRDTGAEWADMMARGMRSEGRLHLHVMQVPQGLNSRYWVIPLRTACSKLHDDLRVLAQGLSADVKERDRMKEIRAILENTRDVLAIH